MNSIIVIGDIHGCAKTFQALLDKLPEGIPVVVSGDYIDRGPRSREVIQTMIDRKILGTKGNHEQMMEQFFGEYSDLIEGDGEPIIPHRSIFLMNGGYKTLREYGINTSFNKLTPPNYENIEVLRSHLEWIKNLPIYLEFPNVVNLEGRHLIVSHSSIADEYHKNDKNEEMILWGRPRKVVDVPGIYNIYGHSVVKKGGDIQPHYANLDTGAVFASELNHGVLTALQYPEMVLYEQVNIDNEVENES